MNPLPGARADRDQIRARQHPKLAMLPGHIAGRGIISRETLEIDLVRAMPLCRGSGLICRMRRKIDREQGVFITSTDGRPVAY